jgi:hypothetical protein
MKIGNKAINGGYIISKSNRQNEVLCHLCHSLIALPTNYCRKTCNKKGHKFLLWFFSCFKVHFKKYYHMCTTFFVVLSIFTYSITFLPQAIAPKIAIFCMLSLTAAPKFFTKILQPSAKKFDY